MEGCPDLHENLVCCCFGWGWLQGKLIQGSALPSWEHSLNRNQLTIKLGTCNDHFLPRGPGSCNDHFLPRGPGTCNDHFLPRGPGTLCVKRFKMLCWKLKDLKHVGKIHEQCELKVERSKPYGDVIPRSDADSRQMRKIFVETCSESRSHCRGKSFQHALVPGFPTQRDFQTSTLRQWQFWDYLLKTLQRNFST